VRQYYWVFSLSKFHLITYDEEYIPPPHIMVDKTVIEELNLATKFPATLLNSTKYI
jgi:hypothetical protein